MSATPRQAFDVAVERLVAAIDAGDRQAALTALADAQAHEPPDARRDAVSWLERERERAAELADDLDAEPKGWGRG